MSLEKAVLSFLIVFSIYPCLGQDQWLKGQSDSLSKIWNDQSYSKKERAQSLCLVLEGVENPDDFKGLRHFSNILIDFSKEHNLKNELACGYKSKASVFEIDKNPDSAIVYLNKALEIKKNSDDVHEAARLFLKLGENYKDLFLFDEAIEKYNLAIEILKNTKDQLSLAMAYNNIANIHVHRGKIKEAIKYLTKTLKIYENQEYTFGVQKALSNIGNIYYDQQDYSEAFNYYNKSYQINKEENFEKESIGSLIGLGNTYHMLEEIDSAETAYLNAIDLLQTYPNKYDEALLFNNLGNLYYETGANELKEQNGKKNFEVLDKSVNYHQKAYSIQKEINDIVGMSYSLSSIAEVYYLEGNQEKAIEFGEKALNLAKEGESITDIKYVSFFLYEVYKIYNKPTKALEMYELYVETRDKLINQSNQEEIVRQKLKYEYEKKSFQDSLKAAQEKEFIEKELQLSDLKLEKEKSIRYSLLVGLGLVLLFGILMYNRFKVTRRKNKIIEAQKRVVDVKNKEIIDSINYAKRLQDAILPPNKLITSYLLDSFILYRPKDIVAGDFYFMDVVEEDNKKLVYYATADCTGHGVPGAIVSIVGANGLKRCIQELNLRKPGEILEVLSKIVAENFSQSEKKIRDGMDIALCCLEFVNNKPINLHYAGANIPLLLVNPNRSNWPSDFIQLKDAKSGEIKPDKQAIGYSEESTPFVTHTIETEKGDTLYTFSDGYADQFGGPQKEIGGKKFKTVKLKNLFVDIYNQSMDQQKETLTTTFDEWKGDLEQVDDVCVIGVRL
ncbi:MAG: hypothetical protein COA32_02000 [Fluviicola sp.]|nr:MAG: hypothetical protein COA32_02000 [Fluviicola sp.]